MKNTITFIRSACLFVCIVFMAQGCQKDNSTSEVINFSPAGQELNSNAEFNSQLSEEDMLLQIDTDFNFNQYGLIPNYDFSKVIDVENVNEKHVYIPLMNSSNEMVDLFLGMVIGGKLEYLYFSNFNENRVKNSIYEYFYNCVGQKIKPNHLFSVNKHLELENRDDDIDGYCPVSYWYFLGINTSDCEWCGTWEHVIYYYPCARPSGGSGTTFSTGPSSGGSSGGDGTPRPDEIFDDCIEIIGVAAITDLIAAEQYHEECGCNGFMLSTITTSELDEIYEFNNELDEELERCKRDVCKVDIWPTLKARFNEINLPCMDEQMEMEDLYEQAMLSSNSCNPSMTDLLEELTEISGGSYIVKSDFGYTTNIIIGEELRSQLGYLTNGGSQSGYLTNGGCISNLEELLSNLTDDQICSLIGLDPGQIGSPKECSLESTCLMTNILLNGEAAIPQEYPEGFFDCVMNNDEIGDEVEEILFLNDEVYVAGEDFVSVDPLDLSTVVDCFSGPRDENNTIYTVSIHVFQPKEGSREPWVWKDQLNNPFQIEFGHTWVSLISKTEVNLTPPNPSYDVNRRLYFGFYPAAGGKPTPKNEQTKTKIGAIFPEPITRNAEVIRTWEIQESDFDVLLSQLENFPEGTSYHLDDYNCTDFAIEFVNHIGLNVPETHGTWYNGGGSNCGDLGEDLRDMSEGELSSGGNNVQICN